MSKRRKHWRKKIEKNLLPARADLLQYSSLLDKITQVAIGNTVDPLDITRRFYRAANTKTKCLSIEVTPSVVRELTLEEEEIKQQCWLYLVELWDFWSYTWKKTGKKATTIFYDYVRANLSRWIGSYVGLEIARKAGESMTDTEIQEYEMEDPRIFNLDLGWVMLQSKDGIFSNLTIKQKYLLYLRYNKEMKNSLIVGLLNSNLSKVEQEFSTINKVLNGERNATTRCKSKELK